MAFKNIKTIFFLKFLRSYVTLSRIDKPTGYLLLWFPSFWGILLANAVTRHSLYSIFSTSFLLFLGSVILRAAGCVWNDIVDRDFDKLVSRTRTRPIASGDVTVKQAGAFLLLLMASGLCVFLLLSSLARIVSLVALFLACLYPFTKRVTYWPQAWLGVTFNGGVWIGWLSFTTDGLLIAACLYGSLIFWTLGYDTIYAHQDRRDDVVAGVRSLAIKMGKKSQWFIGFSYGVTLFTFFIVGRWLQAPFFFYVMILFVAVSLYYQVLRLNINDARVCRSLFEHNSITGFLITCSFLVVAFKN